MILSSRFIFINAILDVPPQIQLHAKYKKLMLNKQYEPFLDFGKTFYAIYRVKKQYLVITPQGDFTKPVHKYCNPRNLLGSLIARMI